MYNNKRGNERREKNIIVKISFRLERLNWHRYGACACACVRVRAAVCVCYYYNAIIVIIAVHNEKYCFSYTLRTFRRFVNALSHLYARAHTFHNAAVQIRGSRFLYLYSSVIYIYKKNLFSVRDFQTPKDTTIFQYNVIQLQKKIMCNKIHIHTQRIWW